MQLSDAIFIFSSTVTEWNAQDCGISKAAQDTSMLPSKFDQKKVPPETRSEVEFGFRWALMPFCLGMLPLKALSDAARLIENPNWCSASRMRFVRNIAVSPAMAVNKAALHCKKFQVVSTNYYLVTSSTEILRSVHFWLQSVARKFYFLVGSTFTENFSIANCWLDLKITIHSMFFKYICVDLI